MSRAIGSYIQTTLRRRGMAGAYGLERQVRALHQQAPSLLTVSAAAMAFAPRAPTQWWLRSTPDSCAWRQRVKCETGTIFSDWQVRR